MRPRLRVLWLAACSSVAAAGFAGCLRSYTFGEGASGDAGGDATGTGDSGGHDATSGGDAGDAGDATSGRDAPSGTDSAADAPADAPGSDAPATDAPPPPPDAGISASTVASAGSKVFSTGFGYQVHQIYATNDQRFWLFYVDDSPGQIKTQTSTDLVTWTSGAAIALPSSYSLADGSDFSVVYADLAGIDVVHLVVNATAAGRSTSFHIRATIAAGAITGTAPVALPDTDSNGSSGSSGSTCPQAGPATVVASDGRVWDVTAWTGHPSTTCDTNIYVSPAADLGTQWNTMPFSHDGYFVSVPSYAFAHTLVALANAGVVLALWPDEDNTAQTVFDSIGWSLSPAFHGGGPGTTGDFPDAAAELFSGSGTTASYDDWTACRLSDASIHALRHVLASGSTTTVGAFEELVYDGSQWQPAAPAAAATGLSNSGVVLVSDANAADGMLLATLGTDSAVNLARWTPTAGWVVLPKIPATAPRQALAGSGCGSKRPALFWTEGAGPTFAIMGADVSRVFGP